MTSPPPNYHRLIDRIGAWLAGDDADLSRETPSREIVTGVVLIGLAAAIFVGWGLIARLDEGVYAQGRIAVAGNRRTVQHREGGIVSEIDVHEGDHVREGQILLKLNPADLKASAGSVTNELIGQLALRARLMAEITHARAIAFPPEFASYVGETAATAQAAETLQRTEFSRRETSLSFSHDVLQQQIKESGQQSKGYDRQLISSREQQRLIQEEIDGLQDLYSKGLVPATRMRSLQRNSAQIEGDAGAYAASQARTQQEIGEKRIRMQSLVADRDADAAKELRLAEQQIGELTPKLAALREQIDRTIVKAPASGEVLGLVVFTIGGVVTPGQKLMDIVPGDTALVIEARVRPSDAEDLHPGQPAEIRITALHERRMPKLMGVITKVSADSMVDDKTGATFFRIETTVPPTERAKVRDARGVAEALRPGLTAEVLVPLHPRTALDYLTSPLSRMLWRSFREH